MATPILMPRQGQSVESCILTEWLVKPGDTVESGAAVASIETDKATFEVEAPESGTLLEVFFEEGDDIPVLTHIAAIGEPGEDVSSLRPEEAGADESEEPAASPEPEPEPEPAAPQPQSRVRDDGAEATPGRGISPRARRRAEADGVQTDGLSGTGPGGRVIERDVVAAASSQPRMSGAAREASGSAAVPASGSGPAGMVLSSDLDAGAEAHGPAAEPGAVTEIKVAGARKIIAERMKASLQGTAQLTLHRGFNAEPMLAYRSRIKESGETLGLPNITVNDLIAFAVTRVLSRHPGLNAHFLGDRILQFADVNLGIAVDTPRGLMVPVLQQANRRSLSEISESIKPLAASCLEGSPNPDDLTGGTFTITNLGALGVETFTPVLNAPEVAILGVGGLVLKPLADGDGIRHVRTIDLSLTIDHQAVDGAPGARFLADLVNALEHIDLTLAG